MSCRRQRPEEQLWIPPYIFLSANGVSETGELVNIDGTGNRAAASLFGPERVFYVIGRNKIAPDLHSAIARAKNTACTKSADAWGKDALYRVRGAALLRL